VTDSTKRDIRDIQRGGDGNPPPLREIRPLLLSAGEVARVLGVSTRTLWRLQSGGRLPEPVRLGGSTRWRVSDIERWVAEGCAKPQEAIPGTAHHEPIPEELR
jgi:excisionase family DNA binding protein